MATRTASPQLDIDVRRCDDGATVITLRGELKVHTAVAARRAIAGVVDGEPASSITIDLAEISAIDVAGLAAVTAPAVGGSRRIRPLSIVPPRHPDAARLVARVGVVEIINRTRS